MSLHRSGPLAALAALVLCASPALAHHPMDGEIPATLMQGLLSGLAHPVIGVDHLAFLVAAGLVVSAGALPLWLPAVFVAASAAGVGVHLAEIDLPGTELVIAASVLGIGIVLAKGAHLPAGLWAGVFALVGLFHGYAFGESIVGAEAAPLAGYLVGLVAVQSALAIGVALAAGRQFDALAPRLAGAAAAGVGFAALAGQIAG